MVVIDSEFVFRFSNVNPANRATTVLFEENLIILFIRFPNNLPMYIPTTSANRMSFVCCFIGVPEFCYSLNTKTFATLFERVIQHPRLHHLPFQDQQHSCGLSQAAPYTVEEHLQLRG